MLDRQNVPLAFAKGLDTKTDPKQVMMGKLLLLQNAVFTSPMSIRKRYGVQSLGLNVEGGGLISAGKACISFQKEFNLFDGNSLYSFSEADQTYSNKGSATSLNVSVKPVIRNCFQQTNPNSAYHPSGFIVETWDDSRGGSRYSIIDRITGDIILSDALLPATATNPKPYALGQNFVIFYIDSVSHNLNFVSIAITTPTLLSGVTAFAINVNVANPAYDAVVSGNNIYLVYNNSDGGGGISIKYMTQFLVGSVTRDVAGETAHVINIVADAAQNLWITYYNGTSIKAFVWDRFLTSVPILNPTLIETVARIVNVASFVTGTTMTTFYEQTPTSLNTYDELIRTNTLTLAGAAGTAKVFLRSVGLFSKVFFYNNYHYVTVSFSDNPQPTYFVIREDGKVVGKIAPGNAGGLAFTGRLTEVGMPAPGVFGLAYLIKDLLTSIAGSIYTQTGVNRLELDFGSDATFLRIELGQSLLFNGGFVSEYDGVSVVEHNFHVYPESATIIPFTSGGGIGAGVYSYVWTYEWTDNFGQIQRSTPSIPTQITVKPGTPVSFTGDITIGDNRIFNVSSFAGLIVGQTLTGVDLPSNTHITKLNVLALQIILDNVGTGTTVGETFTTTDTNRLEIGVSTLRLTSKVFPRAPVLIVGYRTEANGTIYHRFTSVTSPVLNDTTVDSTGYIDTLPDLQLIGNEEIYTTGELADFAAPAIDTISIYKNRAMYVPSENRSSIGYSKQVIPGLPVEFVPEFIQNINENGGDITAHLEMDTNFIIFKNKLIFAMSGQGPSANGSNNDFTEPQLIPSPVGCDNPNALILTPQGVIFHSDQGFWLLERSLAVGYIGAQVEEFNNLTFTGAQQIPDTTQIRFTSKEGTTLVYDYFVGEWSVFQNQMAEDCCLFQNQMMFLQADGQAMQEMAPIFVDGVEVQAPSFMDNGEYIKMKLITAWLSLAQMQGWERVRELVILGDYKTPHSLTVQVAYNFIPIFVQRDIIPAGLLLQPQAYGEGSPYGSPVDIPEGGPFPLYQFRVFMNQQKVQSIQFSIEDNGQLPYGEGFSLSNMALEVGVKKGLKKMPANVSFG
jgi:hypothetical protein